MCGCCLILLIAGLVRARGETGEGRRRRRRHTSRASGGYRVPGETSQVSRKNIPLCVGTCGPFEFPRASHLLADLSSFAPIISVFLLVLVQKETKGIKSHGVYKDEHQAASGACEENYES